MFRRLSVVVSALLLAAFAAARPPSEDTAGYPRTPDPSPRDPVVDVMKFIPPAIHAGIRAGSNRDDVSRFVQKAIDSCLVETGTQDFAKRGHGPRGRGTVTFPPGTYNVRNILLRSGVDVRIARGATVRLCDNTVDATMRPPYPPSNVFCTTLDHTGNFDDPHFGPQRWFQGSGARKEQVLSPELRAGQYGTQTEFIVEDVRVFVLPCNVTVEARPDGGSLVRLVNPDLLLSAGRLADRPQMQAIATDARQRLERVAARLRRSSPPAA